MVTKYITCLTIGFIAALTLTVAEARNLTLDQAARHFVRLGLELGEYDDAYIDSFVGPDEWQAEAREQLRSQPELAEASADLLQRLMAMGPFKGDEQQRYKSLLGKVRALDTKVRMLNGETFSFAEEARLILDVTVPRYELSEFDTTLAEIDAVVPGDGELLDRVTALRETVEIPADKLDAVFRRAIDACRERTMQHLSLPDDERFRLEYVSGVSWGGYLEYLGDHESLMSINTDLPITIDRATDLGCHEGYPGHHVYNLLIAKRYLQELGWVEFQLQPLYAPAMLIHEGSAEYGVELAFPAEENLQFQRDVLAPMAGIDPQAVTRWHEVTSLMGPLGDFAMTAISQRHLDGEITREQAVELSQKYRLLSPERAERAVRFAEDLRSYVLNYSLGEELVADYIQRRMAEEGTDRWQAFQRLIYELPNPSDLQ